MTGGNQYVYGIGRSAKTDRGPFHAPYGSAGADISAPGVRGGADGHDGGCKKGYGQGFLGLPGLNIWWIGSC